MFDLLGLPSELRHEIYKLVLVKNSGPGPIMDSRDGGIVLKEGPWLWYRNIGGLGLLTTCRLIWREASVVLYASACFLVGQGVNRNQSHFRRDFLPMIGGNASFVRELHFEVPVGWMVELCEACRVGPGENVGSSSGAKRSSNEGMDALLLCRTGSMAVQPDISGTEIGCLLECLVQRMPALRKLTFRLDAMLFEGDSSETAWTRLDGELVGRSQFFMLWLAATCIKRHHGLKYASWTDSSQTVEFWGGVRDSCERVTITVDLVAKRDDDVRARLEVEGWWRPFKNLPLDTKAILEEAERGWGKSVDLINYRLRVEEVVGGRE